MNSKIPFVLYFTLGNNVSWRSVLGLLTLLAMSTTIDLVSSLLSCVELNRKSSLELYPPSKGLPDSASLNHYSPIFLLVFPII